MQNEDLFRTVSIFVIVIVIAALLSQVISAVEKANEMNAANFKICIESNGTWLNGNCVGAKK